MAKQLQKLDIDSYYAAAIREAKTKELVIKEDELTIPVVTELYERAKLNHKNRIEKMKATTQDLLNYRASYFLSIRDKLAEDIEAEYIKLDKEVAVVSEKANIKKDNKLRLIENKLRVIEDFRASEKEMLAIIDQSIKVERDKQAAGESSWKNISAFIEDIKSKTLPIFKKRKEEEIDPLLKDVKAFKIEIKKIETEVLKATEQINVLYSKKILTLNKEYKQEELRVMDLHRRTLGYLEVQMQTARNNLKKLATALDELTFQRDKEAEEIKKKVLLDRKELLLEFSSNLDEELDDLDSTMDSFNKIGKIQDDMKNLTSFVRKELVSTTKKIESSDSKLLENVVTSKEGN